MEESRLHWAVLLALGLLCVQCGTESGEAKRITGDPCSWGSQCEGAVCLNESQGGEPTGWAAGMCTSLCKEGQCASGQTCTDLTDAPYCLQDCTAEQSDHCREGYLCHSKLNVCFPDCRQVDFCPDDFVCTASGECEYEWPATSEAVLGAPCTDDQGCGTDWCIAAEDANGPTGWTDGMCTQPCPDAVCPDGFGCLLLDEKAWCLPACEGVGCREGYVCQPDTNLCLPDCNQGWECGQGYVCAPDGICKYQWPQLAPIGAPCSEHANCVSGWCLFDQKPDGQPSGWVGGTCSLPCGAGCPPPTKCAVLATEGLCLQPCFGPPDSLDCRPEYVCDPDYKVCLPNCHNDGWECGPNFVCTMMGICKPPGPGPGG